MRLTLTHPAGSNKPHRVVDPSSDRISARWPLDNSCTRRYIKGRCSEARRSPSDLSSLHCDDTRRLIASQGSLWSPLWSYTCGQSGVSLRMSSCMCPTVLCRIACTCSYCRLYLNIGVHVRDLSVSVHLSAYKYVYVRLLARGDMCVLLSVSFCLFSCICERFCICLLTYVCLCSHVSLHPSACMRVYVHLFMRKFRASVYRSSQSVSTSACTCASVCSSLWVRLDMSVFIRLVCFQVSMPASNFGQWMWL